MGGNSLKSQETHPNEPPSTRQPNPSTPSKPNVLTKHYTNIKERQKNVRVDFWEGDFNKYLSFLKENVKIAFFLKGRFFRFSIPYFSILL